MQHNDSPNFIAWQGDSWRLRVEQRKLNDGRLVEKGYIQHPGAVVLVPVRQGPDEPEILMLRQYRQALSETILELPAGTRGWNEDWLDCAQRELREETGYRAGRLQSLGRCWPAPGLSNEVMAIYLATDLVPDPLPQDHDEIIELQPMALSDLVRLALNGELQDAKSVVGILRSAAVITRPGSSR